MVGKRVFSQGRKGLEDANQTQEADQYGKSLQEL